MSYPLNHNARGLAAILVVFDLTGTEMYRYEMPSVAVTPVQNFPFTGVDLNMGINENSGLISIFIDDRDKNFIENIGGDIRSKFKPGWTIQIFCGKEPASVTLWALAVLQDIDLNYDTNNFFQTLHCNGYGIRLQHRYSIMKRSQKRLADAITPDPADVSTYVSQLFKDVLIDTDHLATQGLGQLDITTGNVQEIAIPIAEFDKNIVSFGTILTELAVMGFAWYGVDQNKVAFLYKKGEVSSGFLVSNDTSPEPNDTSLWATDKRMFFRNMPNIIHDQSSDSAFSILQAVGAQRLVVDHDKQVHTTSDIDTNNAIFAFKFVPIVDNVAQIIVFLSSSGAIGSDLIVSIVGESGGNPNLLNIRKSVTINSAQLQKEIDVTGKFFKIRFDKIPVTKGETLFVVFSKTTNVGVNALNLSYEAGTGNYFRSTDGGASWTTPAGEPAFVTYSSKNTRIIAESATTTGKLLPKEAIINLPDTPTEQAVFQVLESLLQTLTKVIRNYDPITVSTPNVPPELGKSIRLINTNLSMDTEVDLIGYSLSINAHDNSNRGATEMQLMFQGIYI